MKTQICYKSLLKHNAISKEARMSVLSKFWHLKSLKPQEIIHNKAGMVKI